MSDENGGVNNVTGAEESPPERTRPRPRTAKALPTDRLKFEMQVRALKALAMESQNGSHPVGAPELAKRIGVAETTAPLNNAFFADAGLEPAMPTISTLPRRRTASR